MTDATQCDVVLIGDEVRLDLTQFARTCGTTTTFIEELILEGVLVSGSRAAPPTFGGGDVLRVRKLMRLQRDFDAPLPSAAVILDLLDEIERLHVQLQVGRAAREA